MPEKLGVYGHSMGGTITGQVAGLDPRIKASVPSCGGQGITQAENFARQEHPPTDGWVNKLYSTTIDCLRIPPKFKIPNPGPNPTE